MSVASDIVEALGHQLLRDGLQLTSSSPEDALARLRATRFGSRPSMDCDVRVEDVRIEGDLRLRLYFPKGVAPTGVLVNIHGGGWVAGSIEQDDDRCRALSNLIGCATVSVGYRLAPENPFPAGLHDCVVAIRWAHSQAAQFGAPAGNLALLGASAGANLGFAAQLSIARIAPSDMPKRQILLYPICDSSFDFPSYRENERGYFLTAKDMAWYWDQYLDVADRADPLASILRAPNLIGLPPGLIITSQHDPLRDEGEALAERLNAQGVKVTCVRFLGAIHGFVSLAPESALAQLALENIAHEVRAAFA